MEWRDSTQLTRQTREKNSTVEIGYLDISGVLFLFEMFVWLSLLLGPGLVWLEDIWCVAWHVWHGRNRALTSQPIQCLQSGCDPVTNRPSKRRSPWWSCRWSQEPLSLHWVQRSYPGFWPWGWEQWSWWCPFEALPPLSLVRNCRQCAPPDSLANFSHADDNALGLDLCFSLQVAAVQASTLPSPGERLKTFVSHIWCLSIATWGSVPGVWFFGVLPQLGPGLVGFFGMKADLRIKNWEHLFFLNPLWIPFIVCT